MNPCERCTAPENRLYEPHTERIPPLGTKVEVVFEPVVKK